MKFFFYYNFLVPFLRFIGTIKWDWAYYKIKGRRWGLTTDDWLNIANKLSEGHYVILTHRKTHLTTYLINAGDWIKRPRWGFGYWSHGLINETTNFGAAWAHYKLIEAISKGVVRSDFKDCFNCEGVVILKIPGYTKPEMVEVKDVAVGNLGRDYDFLASLREEIRINCVENLLDGLNDNEGYPVDLPNLDRLIRKHKVLTPQMIYECGDFEIVLEIRR